MQSRDCPETEFFVVLNREDVQNKLELQPGPKEPWDFKCAG